MPAQVLGISNLQHIRAQDEEADHRNQRAEDQLEQPLLQRQIEWAIVGRDFGDRWDRSFRGSHPVVAAAAIRSRRIACAWSDSGPRAEGPLMCGGSLLFTPPRRKRGIAALLGSRRGTDTAIASALVFMRVRGRRSNPVRCRRACLLVHRPSRDGRLQPEVCGRRHRSARRLPRRGVGSSSRRRRSRG
jgi:hypothetical protein